MGSNFTNSLKATADAIRAKTGGTAKMTVSGMAAQVASIQTGGASQAATTWSQAVAIVEPGRVGVDVAVSSSVAATLELTAQLIEKEQ